MRNRFTIGGVLYTDAVIMGGVDYSIDISGDELTVGVAACGVLRFTVRADNNPFSVGAEFVWERQQIDDDDFVRMGKFIVKTITKKTGSYIIESFDIMSKFDVVVDEWLNGLSYPITHGSLLAELGDHVGVQVLDFLVNRDYVIRSSPAWEGVTGRDILGFVAEASGCFARIMGSRVLVSSYVTRKTTLSKANYSRPFVADYTVAPIDKVQVRSSKNDIGVVVGDGENVYIIENNPLFFAESDEEMRPHAELLLQELSKLEYTPCEVPMYNDLGLRPGDIFTIDGKTSIVMSYRCTERGTIISSSGSPRRQVQSNAKNRDVIALIGKTNELTRTVDETKLRMTDAEGNILVLQAAADGFGTSISSVDGRVTTLSATVDGLDTRIYSVDGRVTTLSATVDGLKTTVSDKASTSYVEQTANSVLASVNNNYVKISDMGIYLNGYVTFSNLSTSGQTTINGGNIAAGGTISAVTLKGCTIQSSNGGASITLQNNILNMSLGAYTYGQLVVTDDGRFKITGSNGYIATLYCGNTNPQVQIGSYYYDIVHAGNVGNYLGTVYAVFG